MKRPVDVNENHQCGQNGRGPREGNETSRGGSRTYPQLSQNGRGPREATKRTASAMQPVVIIRQNGRGPREGNETEATATRVDPMGEGQNGRGPREGNETRWKTVLFGDVRTEEAQERAMKLFDCAIESSG